jgi:RNA polymerase III transcription factor (TF)IIIC subunit HTH domain
VQEQVPGRVNWEKHVTKSMTEWEPQVAICKLFEEKPIWARRSIHEQLSDNGYDVSENLLKRFFFSLQMEQCFFFSCIKSDNISNKL